MRPVVEFHAKQIVELHRMLCLLEKFAEIAQAMPERRAACTVSIQFKIMSGNVSSAVHRYLM